MMMKALRSVVWCIDCTFYSSKWLGKRWSSCMTTILFVFLSVFPVLIVSLGYCVCFIFCDSRVD